MLKKTFLPFAAMAVGLGAAAAAAQAAAFVLGAPAGQAAFLLEWLLALVLYTVLPAGFARRQATVQTGKAQLLRIWLPLFAGVLILFAGGQLISNADSSLTAPDMFLSALFEMFWFTAGSYLLLAAAGRVLWGLPLPRGSLRSVGWLCLCVLTGSCVQFLINFFSLSLFQRDTLLGLYDMMAGRGMGRQSVLHGLSMMVPFSEVYAAALTWSDQL